MTLLAEPCNKEISILEVCVICALGSLSFKSKLCDKDNVLDKVGSKFVMDTDLTVLEASMMILDSDAW